MAATILYLLIFSVSLLAFASLAATQKQHQAIFQNPGSATQVRQLTLRLIGSGLLGLSFMLAVVRDGFAFGSVVWTLTITLSAFGVALIIEWLSKRQFAGRKTQVPRDEDEE